MSGLGQVYFNAAGRILATSRATLLHCHSAQDSSASCHCSHGRTEHVGQVLAQCLSVGLVQSSAGSATQRKSRDLWAFEVVTGHSKRATFLATRCGLTRTLPPCRHSISEVSSEAHRRTPRPLRPCCRFSDIIASSGIEAQTGLARKGSQGRAALFFLQLSRSVALCALRPSSGLPAGQPCRKAKLPALRQAAAAMPNPPRRAGCTAAPLPLHWLLPGLVLFPAGAGEGQRERRPRIEALDSFLWSGKIFLRLQRQSLAERFRLVAAGVVSWLWHVKCMASNAGAWSFPRLHIPKREEVWLCPQVCARQVHV